MSHEQLLNMVKSGNPKTLGDRGDALNKAAGTLGEISRELSSHAQNLEWTGDAANQFRTWLKQVSDATANLSTYVATTGQQIQQSGDALGTAQAMPKLPNDQIALVNKRKAQGENLYNDLQPNPPFGWVTQLQATAAQQKIDGAKNEAVDAMVKLSQAYEGAATAIQGQTPPLFPPSPQDVMGPPPTSVDNQTGMTFTGPGSSNKYRPSPHGGGGGTVTPPPVRTTPAPPEPTPPPHFYLPPKHPTPPPVREPIPQPPHDPTPTPPHDPTPTPPGTGIDHTNPTPPTPPGQGGGTTGTLPNGPGYNGSGDSGPGGLPGGFPGLPTGGGSIKGGGSGQYGTINGTGGSSYGGSAGRYGGGRVGGGGLGSEEGITGGVSRPGAVSGRSQLGNNAIGAQEGEEAAAGQAGGLGGGRGGYGPGGGMGGGGAIGGRGVGGGAGRGGRGLVSKAGGEVGGQEGPQPEGEFTKGGSGLGKASAEARGAETEGEGGFMPGGLGAGNKRKKDRRNRADYLVEDEETWTDGTPQSNPDVIE
ncbi:WXG100 family type VII secretion target [Kitasatospora viridis]|uniref:PPE family protein n=1 Tax=Kitasatospora viridis TaxID=281105 RepID=A0A561UFX5_9ACTN|nr:hypothetical protein [Kitasatospora viridis]TWF98257.1 hypothetical protein FHX73_112063 [Kitasatospora viridis]